MTWQPKDELVSAVTLEVLIHGPLGRTGLARRLGLAPATFTRTSMELIASGLLAEVPEATQRISDRPTVPLDVVPSSHHFLGIKLTDSTLDATVIDLKATLRDSYRVPLGSLAPIRVIRMIAGLTRRARSAYCIDAVGIAVDGIMNTDGTVKSAPFPKWHDIPLTSLVSEVTRLPTFAVDDLSACVQIQYRFGSGADHSNFAVITASVGVGCGCIANGARLENEDSGIGLVGYWPLDPLGPIRSQGHRGYAEAMLTTPAVCRDTSAAVGRPLGWNDVITLASEKHPTVEVILMTSGHALGRLIGLMALLTAPELMIIGGEGVALASLSGDAVWEGIGEMRDPRATSIHVTLSDGSNEAWSRGAGVIALQGYITVQTAQPAPLRRQYYCSGRSDTPTGCVGGPARSPTVCHLRPSVYYPGRLLPAVCRLSPATMADHRLSPVTMANRHLPHQPSAGRARPQPHARCHRLGSSTRLSASVQHP